VLGEEAPRMIKEAFLKERVEELESKDSKAESKRRAKLAVQGKREEEKPEKQKSVGASAVARKNPYVSNVQKKGDKDRKVSGREDEFVTPTKDNTAMKAKEVRLWSKN
jgi:hypothetical protein